MSTTSTSIPGGLLLASIGDPDGTRTVISIVAFLIAIGIALLLLAAWIHRTTRPDPELLAPLEMMGDRSWRRGDPVWQRRRLDELRPAGAEPLSPSVAPPQLDASFDAGPSATGFDDLRLDTAPRPSPASSDGEPGSDGAAGPDGSGVAESRPDATPSDAEAPILLEFPDGEFDETALSAAREQLERELAEAGGPQHRARSTDLGGDADR